MKINIKYQQNFSDSLATKSIIKSFGLTSKKENTIITDYNFNLELGKVYYICGYSGSGKSSILRFIYQNLKSDYNIINIEKWDRLEIPNKPLIEFFPNVDIDKKLSIMSKCGLGEAWKFISYYDDLSDGEKFRFVLYKSIIETFDKQNSILIIDEFCATLDRITAKAISSNIKKLADIAGLTIILASAHDDLIDYINADYTIFKEFSNHVEVN